MTNLYFWILSLDFDIYNYLKLATAELQMQCTIKSTRQACKIRCRSEVKLILSFVSRLTATAAAAAKANTSRSMKPNEDNSSMTVIEVFAWLAFTFHVQLEAFFVFLAPSFGATAKNCLPLRTATTIA